MSLGTESSYLNFCRFISGIISMQQACRLIVSSRENFLSLSHLEKGFVSPRKNRTEEEEDNPFLLSNYQRNKLNICLLWCSVCVLFLIWFSSIGHLGLCGSHRSQELEKGREMETKKTNSDYWLHCRSSDKLTLLCRLDKQLPKLTNERSYSCHSSSEKNLLLSLVFSNRLFMNIFELSKYNQRWLAQQTSSIIYRWRFVSSSDCICLTMFVVIWARELGQEASERRNK